MERKCSHPNDRNLSGSRVSRAFVCDLSSRWTWEASKLSSRISTVLMSKLLLLYSTIVVSLVFLLVPDNDVTIGYPFSDMVVSVEYYIYSIFEKFVMIILAYIIWKEADKYEQALSIFFWLMVADLADLVLTYNSIWFHIGDLPISMNVMKSIIFGLTILNVWIRNSFK